MIPTISSERLEDIGYDRTAACSGHFLVLDHDIIESSKIIDGLEVLPLGEAFEKYPHVKDKLFFGLIDREKNEYTRQASELPPVGYYIRVEDGVTVEEPMQAAFLLALEGSTQVIHNIIELGRGARLHIVNGCTTAAHGRGGRHIGITETYLGEESSLGYTMLHNWGSQVEVYPSGAVAVGEGAHYISNYVAMTAVKKIVSNPVAYVKKGGSARFYSIIYARSGAYFDMGSQAALDGEEASGEIISRVVSEGGTVISRQMLTGNVAGAIGHMECSGLLINSEGVIHSIPELRGAHPDINLSHEAAVGKISSEELSYLRTRGLSEEQARALIIRGFLDLKIEGLPDKIQALIDEIISRSVDAPM